jgi:ubiquinone/menaquinone biosynthesis C-methylase UbiE
MTPQRQQEGIMDSQLNAIRDQQRQAWDKFSGGWKKWDELAMHWFAPVAEALIAGAQLRPDATVLDIAAGTGEPGLTAAARVPQGRVVVTDLSEQMLLVAAENAARRGVRNLETRACDVSALPFDNAAFDAIMCRFGFMFFPDISLALSEMRRVARPGAWISTAVWNGPANNSWATTIMSAIASHIAVEPPPPGSPGLFRCAAPGFMSTAFAAAGLGNIREEEVGGDVEFASPEQYWSFMTEVAAPVVANLARGDAAARERVRNTVLEQTAANSKNGRVRLQWSAQVICGQKI